MPKPVKIFLYAVGGLVALLAVVALAVVLFVDVDAHKSRLEAVVSEAVGMEVRIGGPSGIDFFPGVHVTLADVHIRNRGTDLASAKRARLRIDLVPLLRGEFRIDELALRRPTISIERDRDGTFNFEKPQETKGKLPVWSLARLSLSDGTLVYVDKQSDIGFEAEACKLSVRRLRLSGGDGSEFLKHLSLTAEAACGEIRTRSYAMSDVTFSLAGKNGAFDLKAISMRLFGGHGSGSIHADFSGAVPFYDVRYSLSQFRLEEFVKTLARQKVVDGPISFSVQLALQGKTVDEIKRTAAGEISLRAEDIRLYGVDLDRALSRYESSQTFNLVDLGAFFYAGPFGLVLTKGYDFARIFQGSEDSSSEVPALVSEWKIERGVAQAQDVAMATHANRIALQGKVDFANDRFDDVVVALIDDKGCVKVRQTIRGSFQKPVVEKPSVLTSLAGPALELLKKGRDLFGGQCRVFYAGSVAPPK